MQWKWSSSTELRWIRSKKRICSFMPYYINALLYVFICVIVVFFSHSVPSPSLSSSSSCLCLNRKRPFYETNNNSDEGEGKRERESTKAKMLLPLLKKVKSNEIWFTSMFFLPPNSPSSSLALFFLTLHLSLVLTMGWSNVWQWNFLNVKLFVFLFFSHLLNKLFHLSQNEVTEQKTAEWASEWI